MSEKTRAAQQAAKTSVLLNSQAEHKERGATSPWLAAVDFNEASLIALVGTLQLALRHPKFAQGPTAAWVRQFAHDLIKSIPEDRPYLKKVAEMGFNTSFDDIR